VAEAAYRTAGVEARVHPFISDMAEAYGWADLVLARSGALTVATLTVLITAGPTVEDVDPVRFVSNRASGRLGFETARAANPADPKPRFYLALALSQQNDLPAAEKAWRELVADAPPQAPWREAALNQLNSVLAKAGKPVEQVAAPDQPASGGPSQEQIAAASEMTPQARQEMIEGMVAGLAERLKSDPSDKQGWLKLIRAYGVMGDDAKALQAITTARGAHAADAAFVTELASIEASIRQKSGSTQ